MEKAKDILKSLLVLPIGIIAFYMVRHMPHHVAVKLIAGACIVNLYTYIVTEIVEWTFLKIEELD